MAVYIKKEPFKLILAKANMTQIALADKLGVKPEHLNNMIGRRVSVSPSTRDGLMEELEIKNWDSVFEMQD